ncbi:16S rRNA (cytosine(1402)-N(4))-methyltransferase RsmH [Patescibacteria group bacterium]
MPAGQHENVMHVPVMVKEVLEYLSLKPGAKVIDCNIGEGGHAIEIIKNIGLSGRLLGIDRDTEAINSAGDNLTSVRSQVTLVHDEFINLSEIGLANDFTDVSGILFDLGLSGRQIETPGRGFSWRRDEPLDMRMDQSQGLTAAELIQASSEEDLIKVFREYGEVQFASRLVKEMVKRRGKQRIVTTKDLAKLATEVAPQRTGNYRIHPATTVFQALRIAVNAELKQLSDALPQALSLLKSGGRIVIISFHSLEDRIVKNWLRQEAKDCICPNEIPVCRCEHQAQLKILTKHPVIPSVDDLKENPRARSAKLRAGEKI